MQLLDINDVVVHCDQDKMATVRLVFMHTRLLTFRAMVHRWAQQ